MSKSVVLFVPGSYCLLSLYQPLFDKISKAGVTIQGIALPTIGPESQQGRNEAAPSMYDDAAVIAQAAEELADSGKDVILVGHSYAGIPMSQCTKGLGKQERREQGKSGGIVRLGYMAALVPSIGQSAGGLFSTAPGAQKPTLSIDDYGWMQIGDAAGFAGVVCQDLSADEGKAVIEGFAKHSAQSFGNELTHAGYLDIPASWLLCEEDLAGPPAFQRQMIAQMEEAASGRKVAVTSIKASHMANLSKPNEVASWVINLASMK